MGTTEITFDSMPKAIGQLFAEISEIKQLLSEKEAPTLSPRVPVEIDRACEILHKAKPTVYTLARKREISSCKVGGKLLFFEDELLDYIQSGRRKTVREIQNAANGRK